MKAVPQEHDGRVYRSRTEARWGEFWTLAGIDFEYEPERFQLLDDRYVPDFLVHGVYFEIKPKTARKARELRLAGLLADDQNCMVVIAAGNPGHAFLRAYHPGGTESSAFIVEEFKSDSGAWLAEFADGGGWALPLAPDLKNCSATGEEHPLLAIAGRLQFNKPKDPAPPVSGLLPIAEPTIDIINRIRMTRRKGAA